MSTAKAANKRRAPMSCDRCKSRKTKCVDPVPGPCQFCASINAVCILDPSRRRQRPYYHVSEEEFRYMTKALEHFLPGVDLNLQTLREAVQSLDGPGGTAGTAAPAVAPSAGPAGLPAAPRSETSSSDSALAVSDDSHTTPASSTAPSKADDADDADHTLDEIDALHGELGWLRIDSRGTYRHIGPDSGYGFHAAVRSLRKRRGSADLVHPLTAAPPLPPSAPESPAGAPSPHHAGSGAGVGVGAGAPRGIQIFLPRRDLCNRCVSRFFRDIQSVYWFWSAERFYAVLDRLYAGDLSSARPAVLCSLYAILALTCESEARAAARHPHHDPATAAPPPAAKYLSLAKGLMPALCDEADTDSVRALCLLSSIYNTTAYVYLGAAARIALTLGLHVPRAAEPKGCLHRQLDLRLYSTLYLLDLDIALCYGNPPALGDEQAADKPQGLLENILGPGSHMPLGYLAVSCELTQMRRRLISLLYARTGTGTGTDTGMGTGTTPPKPTLAALRAVLASLRAWHEAIPPHLRDGSQAASFHKRSVSVLHLRYWSTTIFATRPFLLYCALHADALAALPPAKRAAYEALSAACVDAAQKSLAVVALMRDAGLLSSLVTLDTGCILEILQVFLLALACGQAARADDVRACLQTLQGMEQIFWTSHALTEVLAQLEENGLLNGDSFFTPRDDGPPFFLGTQPQQDIISGVMEAYFSDLQDPFFDDEAGMLGDHFPDGMADKMSL